MRPVVERVSNYPRPPALVPCNQEVVVRALGTEIVRSRRSLRVCETFHPPTFYIHPEDVRLDLLQFERGSSFCEWKGAAEYRSIVVGDKRLSRACWLYPQPTSAFKELAGWLAFYPALMDGCWVDGEQVQPQHGGFYGGWITSAVEGPFKGDPLYPHLI